MLHENIKLLFCLNKIITNWTSKYLFVGNLLFAINHVISYSWSQLTIYKYCCSKH